MALPTLDATFASAADLPRKQMLAKWLVEETGETAPTYPSNVLVSNAGYYQWFNLDGIYTYNGQINGKPSYRITRINPEEFFDVNIDIFYSNDIGIGEDVYSGWLLYGNSFGISFAIALENTSYPWEATTWEEYDAGENIPTVTESIVTGPSPISNYYDLPERYLWAKIAVAAGASKTEADYISLPKQYVWKDIYDAVSGSSAGLIQWSEKQALGHIAAAYRGDTANPANLATYIDWPWRYQVASIITSL